MKKKLLIMGVALSAMLNADPAVAQLPWNKRPQALFLVYSNNAGFFDTEELRLLNQKAGYETIRKAIGESRRNPKFQIKILLTTHSSNVVFSGTGKELEQDGARISKVFSTFEARCNDLARTYDNILRDIKLNDFKRIRIVHIGKFVHAPEGCSGKNPIQVPQALPDTLPLAAILKTTKYAEFTALNVHQDQHKMVFNYFESKRLGDDSRYPLMILRADETRSFVEFNGVPESAGGQK